MQWQRGSIVLATAGRDAGQYFAVVAAEAGVIWLADGRHRRLAAPKRKNKKHVQLTGVTVPEELLTERRLRIWLGKFAAAQETEPSRGGNQTCRKKI